MNAAQTGLYVDQLTVTWRNGHTALRDASFSVPRGSIAALVGVNGSGKSTLINDTLFPIAQRQLNGATIAEPAPYRDIQGLEHFDKVIDIDFCDYDVLRPAVVTLP